jgi:glycosyltransferase involved in cell wall biosynthesis/SAM-dependent methyltransferase
MKLSEAYRLDEELSVWRRGEVHEFAYTDGDAVEQRIKRIVAECKDPGLFSPEIANAITDWPSLYHLGRGRLNLMWPFKSVLIGDILEIGCGCGAMTRALGEFGANVLALEGSFVRSEITASRCRGLSNVSVVNDSFDRFEHDKGFDVVTLIGVLEYARQYFKTTSCGDPVLEMLNKARSFLRPGGVLLLAIENQLGLKYLAGSPEDHNGIPMYGVEDLYGANDVVTFGEDELRRLLSAAGLTEQQWWYPFPDYKFPVSIISERGVQTRSCDLSPLLQNSVLTDYQRAPTSFSLETAWLPVLRNGLAGALANSFAVLASDQPLVTTNPKILAYHYASGRREAFAKQVAFFEDEAGRVCVRHQPLFEVQDTEEAGALSIEFEETTFVSGRHWQAELIHILNRPGWSIESLKEWAECWYKVFFEHAHLGERGRLDKTTSLAGSYFDAVPRNLIIRTDGTGSFIDQEWQQSEACSLGFLVFRSLGLSFFGVTSVARPVEGGTLRIRDLVFDLASHIGIDLGIEDLPDYVQRERTLQELVTGRPSTTLTLELFNDIRLEVRFSFWHPEMIGRLEAALMRKDQDLGFLAEEKHRLESVVRAKDGALAEQADEIHRLEAALMRKDQDLGFLAEEKHRLESVVRAKDGALAEHADEIHRLEAALMRKDQDLGFLAEEKHRLESVVRAKDGALAEQADEIHRLEAHAALKQAEISTLVLRLRESEAVLLDQRSAEIGTLQEEFEVERTYFYAEVAKRDNLLAEAATQLAQLRAEFQSKSGELRALRQTRWFHLREVLLVHPFGFRKIIHLGCIIAGGFMPRTLRLYVASRLAKEFGPASTQAPSAADAGAYRVKLPSAPSGNAPRVVHVIANFMTGGSSRLVIDLVEHLGNRYQQCVLTSFNPSPPAYTGLHIEECRFPESPEPFVDFYKRVRPALVHVHYWGDCDEPWYAKAIEAAAMLSLPVIENINTPIDPFHSEAVAKYIYVSDYVRSVFGEADAHHVTVYPGSDFNLFTRTQHEHAPEDCVGMVYRLERDKLNEKSILPFIRIAQLRARTRILIIGGGSLLEPFKAAVQAAGVTDNFEFTGYVSYDALPDLYRRMSLFVAPVWKESFGQVSPFAMSMKVPVIGYDVGAIPEIIGTSELVAPAGDAEALARIALRLLDAPQERQAIGDAQQHRAQANFSVQAMIDHYAEIYAEVTHINRKESV